MTEIGEIQDYMIYRVIKDRGGNATKKQIFEALGTDDEAKRIIEEKLKKMTRFGIVMIDEEENVKIQ